MLILDGISTVTFTNFISEKILSPFVKFMRRLPKFFYGIKFDSSSVLNNKSNYGPKTSKYSVDRGLLNSRGWKCAPYPTLNLSGAFILVGD